MSDDEYYYDEYDELNEILYDADAEPDLADDLAAHATYSPIWQDDPSEELRDYFSDWEYYSDDYFDDDPKLLERDVKVAKSGSKKTNTPKRGRKRKLSEVRDDTEQKRKEIAALTACLQGTVWKGVSPEPSASFRIGIEKPVALKLSKDIMTAAYNKERGFGRGRLTRDESWANNLSLADMGLTTAKGTSMHEQGAGAAQEEDEDDDEYGDGDDMETVNGVEDMLDSDALEAESTSQELSHIKIQPESAPLEMTGTQPKPDTESRPHKRRKADRTQTHVNQNPLPTPDGSLDSEGGLDVDELGGSAPEKRKGRPRKGSVKEKTSAALQQKDEGIQTQGRKRKLSISESSATASTASSRAKRIATEQVVETTAAATRPRRKK